MVQDGVKHARYILNNIHHASDVVNYQTLSIISFLIVVITISFGIATIGSHCARDAMTSRQQPRMVGLAASYPQHTRVIHNIF
jgi:hypothetical protein